MFFAPSLVAAAQKFYIQVERSEKLRRKFDRAAQRTRSRAIALEELRLRSRIAGECSQRSSRRDQAPVLLLPGRRAQCSVPRAFSSYQGDF